MLKIIEVNLNKSKRGASVKWLPGCRVSRLEKVGVDTSSSEWIRWNVSVVLQ